MKTLDSSAESSIPNVSKTPEEQPSLKQGNNAAARALLAEWMADESGYDERVWPQVKQLIEEQGIAS